MKTKLDWRRVEMPDTRNLADNEVVTQYGKHWESGHDFRTAPRHADRRAPESDISILLGRKTVAEATLAVTGRRAGPTDAVRYSTVGKIRAAGFHVSHTPSRRNPDHASVTVAGGHIPWTEVQELQFDQCWERSLDAVER